MNWSIPRNGLELVAAAILCVPFVSDAADNGRVMPSSDPILESAEGAQLYTARCAVCHDHPGARTPPKILIATIRSPEEVAEALSHGVMRSQAAGLSDAQIRGIAIYLTGHAPAASTWNPLANRCQKPAGAVRFGAADWNGWGRDDGNTRFQPDGGLSAEDVPRLKLRWSFAYSGRAAFGQPTAVGDRVFTGGGGSYFVALDARTGCTHWSYEVGALARTAAVVGTLPGARDSQMTVFFGDDKGRIHALDANTGKRVWVMQVDDHPLARILGTPKLYGGRLYVPVTSMEELAAANPEYLCCTFRGSIVSLDAATGRVLWQQYTVRERPKPIEVNGQSRYGPAGGAIFGSPTIDVGRKLLYAGTGDSYTDIGSDSTDAVLALDLRSGQRRWTSQVLKGDASIVMCDGSHAGNCPVPLGPDFDFSSSPILVKTRAGRRVLIGGAKSGIVYAFDVAGDGRVLWSTAPLARGTAHGAILWGMAADGAQVYVATSEYDLKTGTGPGALAALDIATGGVRWRTSAPNVECGWGTANCSHAQIAAVTAIDGIVFSGAMDGHMRAYSSKDGSIVWDFDTALSFDAVNGQKAIGGAIDYGGQTVAHGMLFVNSGSARQPGNALLAFSVDGR
jgi:polyvinyl alcohol dehydrogenase (cytochrome)